MAPPPCFRRRLASAMTTSLTVLCGVLSSWVCTRESGPALTNSVLVAACVKGERGVTVALLPKRLRGREVLFSRAFNVSGKFLATADPGARTRSPTGGADRTDARAVMTGDRGEIGRPPEECGGVD
ncbi:MAG: hypothetical protein ACR5LG_05310 [Sodalis sp. (in: enterobacteria)]|uniref:hypothetical protein n=1 Tax=Sodalis sp. (in: enterobacteria) TaxID=1898979 RepID=UPI003F3F044E